MRPVLTPIIYCGSGANLYPLCDDDVISSSSALNVSTDADLNGQINLSSKALLPLANRPMIAFALQNLFSSGLSNCIILANSSQHSLIVRSLQNIKLIPPPNLAFLTDNKRRPKEIKDHDRAGQGMISFVDSTLSTANTPSSVNGGMRVELLPLGPHDGNQGVNKLVSAEGLREKFRRGPLGTAELLHWISLLDKLYSDPLILPVDLLAPAFPLRDLIDVYVQSHAGHTEAPTACCALYERGAGEGVGRERERDGPPKLIAAYAPEASQNRLAFLCDSDLSSDLAIRRSLLDKLPQIRISTKLLDAHTYIFNKRQIIPLLESNPRLTSLRDHVLPLVAKSSWMKGLRDKANWNLSDQDGDDQESDDVLMDTSEAGLQEHILARNASAKNICFKEDDVRCLTCVVRFNANDGSAFAARANTVATYLECNRWLLKAFSANGVLSDQSEFMIPEVIESNIVASKSDSAITTSAQISTDSLIGLHVTVGERASIKRSAIGHNCEIGRGARLSGCILMDGARVGENVRLENVICCASSVIGDRCTLKDCDVAPGVHVSAETSAKNEKLVGEHMDEGEEGEEGNSAL